MLIVEQEKGGYRIIIVSYNTIMMRVPFNWTS